jgi:beta-galactosidase
VWTGFDYRGEPTPYAWPCINSHFGILDTCGFWKDIAYYYASWWTTNTVLHLLPHWNWPGMEGQSIKVWAFSNCHEVELFLNGQSLGRQTMPRDGHLAWQVNYVPGTLSATGFDPGGKIIAETKVETTGEPAQIQLLPDRTTIKADGKDVSVVNVAGLDAQGRVVPVAMNKINFSLEGAGKILGVGNGDPSSHEPDKFVPEIPVRSIALKDWRWKRMDFSERKWGLMPELVPDFDDSSWEKMNADTCLSLKEGEKAIYRTHITLSEADLNQPAVLVHFKMIDDHGWIYVNDRRVAESFDWQTPVSADIKSYLHAGDNVIAVAVRNDSGSGGLDQNINLEVLQKPRPLPWSRSLFNGLAQILIQSTSQPGEIKLTAVSDGLRSATTTVQTEPCALPPSLP